MKSIVTLSIVFLISVAAIGQRRTPQKPKTAAAPISIQTAITKDGRTVLLKSDGTWEFSNDPAAPTKDNSNAMAAIKALRVMAGATEVGINYQEYGRRLIDLKATVDDALSAVPDGEEVKSEINESLLAYTNAGQAWSRLIGRGSRSSEAKMLADADSWARDLQKKYRIPTEAFETHAGPLRLMKESDVLNTLWAAAMDHLKKAESLLLRRVK